MGSSAVQGVDNYSRDRLHDRELGSQAQSQEHEEEHHGPEMRQWQSGNSLRIDDERQSWSGNNHFLDLLSSCVRHETDEAEDNKARVEAGQAVGAGDEDGIPENFDI